MNGILPVNKPPGITTYDLIRALKRSGYKGKVGHAGTLDPFAEGLVIILLGGSTKLFSNFQKMRKRYLAEAVIGAKSSTLDSDGEIEVTHRDVVKQELVDKTAANFLGEIEQVVPAYSAVKYKGKPLYKYARKGDIVPEKSKKVAVYSIEAKVDRGHVGFDILCSSGTYIRQLTYDVLQDIGVDSYLDRLVRVCIGQISVEGSASITDIDGHGWQKYLISDKLEDVIESI